MKKEIVSAILLSSLLTLGLAGCGSKEASSDTSTASSQGAAATEASSAVASTDASKEAAAPADGDNVIKIAASETPHAEILDQAAKILEKKGYKLEVKVFDDYIQPNNVVESGDFDANYFQHVNYLNSFNKEKGTHIAIAKNGKIHYEPIGIYAGTKKDLKDIADGDA
ncbi:MAG: metal ABC transporter substrate-binding protein, partial [Lachnospiraceae bacterium]|nr:metal ABC transporter substrate-binding protein [Lachnospiraceae bacterium]